MTEKEIKERLRKLENGHAILDERFSQVIKQLESINKVIQKHADAMESKRIVDAGNKGKLAAYGSVAIFFLVILGEVMQDVVKNIADGLFK
jgi:hypothetical protein